MLARCPKCDQRFAVVGSCVTACPFCAAQVQVSVQRLVGAPQTAVESRVEEHARTGSSDAIEPTLAPPAARDKISGAASASGATSAGPLPPPPRLGPPRVRWLFLQPAEFFARLERGRPRLRPGAGVALLVAGGGVQGASFAGFLPGAPSPEVGAAIGAGLALAAALFLFAAYRAALRAGGAGPELVPRVWPILGYGFVPMALALIPYGGLPAALGTSAAAHARGLEHHLGLSAGVSQGIVLVCWLAFGLIAAVSGRSLTG